MVVSCPALFGCRVDSSGSFSAETTPELIRQSLSITVQPDQKPSAIDLGGFIISLRWKQVADFCGGQYRDRNRSITTLFDAGSTIV